MPGPCARDRPLHRVSGGGESRASEGMHPGVWRLLELWREPADHARVPLIDSKPGPEDAPPPARRVSGGRCTMAPGSPCPESVESPMARMGRGRQSVLAGLRCPRRKLPPLPRKWLALAVLAGVYFAAGKLGLRLAFEHASATAVWPPTGIALAAMLLYGSRV